MSSFNNTVYPPILRNFLPAFIYSGMSGMNIPFEISEYNNLNQVAYVQISITNITTNESAFKSANISKVITLALSNSVSGNYFTLPYSELQNNSFGLDNTYKIQARFIIAGTEYTSTFESLLAPVSSPIVYSQTLEAINNVDLQNSTFTEWSTVCIFKAISEPELTLYSFEDSATSPIGLTEGNVNVNGAFSFASGFENEAIKNYTYSIYANSNNALIYTSSKMYPESNLRKSINFILETDGLGLVLGDKYYFVITAITDNNYTYTSKKYYFFLASFIVNPNFHPTITTAANIDSGAIEFHLENDDPGLPPGTVWIKRTDYHSNYTVWENIYKIEVGSPKINISFSDYTTEDGCWYKYGAQIQNTNGGFSQREETPEIYVEFDYAFLVAESRSLCLRFNHTMTNYKPNISRAKVDTLGNKYTKFIENGIMNYKSFGLTGTISYLADEEFLTKSAIYGTFLAKHDEKVENPEYDYAFEKLYREEIINWLNNGEPKLYKSPTEPNMIVILSEISLTPNKTLSKMVYDVSMTAYQVASALDLQTLQDLDIWQWDQTIPSEADDGIPPLPPDPIVQLATEIHQLFRLPAEIGSTNVLSTYFSQRVLAPRYQQKSVSHLLTYNPRDIYLTNVRIQFYNKPHVWLKMPNGNLELVQSTLDLNNLTPGLPIYEDNDPNSVIHETPDLILGYKVIVNEQEFFVNSRGIFYIPQNIKVTSLVFPQASIAINPDRPTIDCLLNYEYYENPDSAVSFSFIDRNVLGQWTGILQMNVNIFPLIAQSFFYEKFEGEGNGHKIQNKIDYLTGLAIEALRGDVFGIKYLGSADYTLFEIGFTGFLNMSQDSDKIDGIKYLGRHFDEQPYDQVRFLRDWQYALSPLVINEKGDIPEPLLPQVVYNTTQEGAFISIGDSLFPFDLATERKLSPCFDANITYTSELLRLEY